MHFCPSSHTSFCWYLVLTTRTSLACFTIDLHRLPCMAALVKSPLCQRLEACVRAAQEERCLMLTVQDAPDPLPAGALPVPAAAAKRKRAGVARGTALLLEELPHGPGGMPLNACPVQHLWPTTRSADPGTRGPVPVRIDHTRAGRYLWQLPPGCSECLLLHGFFKKSCACAAA